MQIADCTFLIHVTPPRAIRKLWLRLTLGIPPPTSGVQSKEFSVRSKELSARSRELLRTVVERATRAWLRYKFSMQG